MTESTSLKYKPCRQRSKNAGVKGTSINPTNVESAFSQGQHVNAIDSQSVCMWSECQLFLWLTLTEANEQRYAVPKSVLQPRQILLFTEFYFYWDAGRKKTFDNNQTVDWDDSSCWGLRVCYRLCVKCRGLHLEVTHEILNAKKLTSEATARQWRHHAAASRKSVGAVSCNWSSVVVAGDRIEFAQPPSVSPSRTPRAVAVTADGRAVTLCGAWGHRCNLLRIHRLSRRTTRTTVSIVLLVLTLNSIYFNVTPQNDHTRVTDHPRKREENPHLACSLYDVALLRDVLLS